MTGEPLDPIALSALQHWYYCPRQCALIHVEQVFEENLFTQRGHLPASPLGNGGVGWNIPVVPPSFGQRMVSPITGSERCLVFLAVARMGWRNCRPRWSALDRRPR